MGKQIEHELKPVTFEEAFMPHVDAAYNVARWLTRNDMVTYAVFMNEAN
jgi:hypothetical protein